MIIISRNRSFLWMKSYFFAVLSLSVLTFLLNYCTFIYQCALVFSAISVITHMISGLYGRKNALKGLGIATLISLVLSRNLAYYIDGHLINGLAFISLISVMISMYCSSFVLQKILLGETFKNYNFAIFNIIAISVSAALDCIIMGLFFIINNNLSYMRIVEIFARELSCKIIFGVFILSAIIISIKISEMHRNFKSRT